MSLKNLFTKKTGLNASSKSKKAMLLGIVSGLLLISLIGSASASSFINTTMLTGLLGDMGDVVPAIGDFFLKIVPTLFLIATVMFVFKFYDEILDAITSAMKFGR